MYLYGFINRPVGGFTRESDMINKLRILHEFQIKNFGVIKSDISISVHKNFITFSAVHNDNVIMGEIYAHGSSNEWDNAVDEFIKAVESYERSIDL